MPISSTVGKFICAYAFLSTFAFLSAYSGGPDWVRKRPVNTDYYIGIGSISKEKTGLDFKQAAKNAALGDLSSEISVSLSADFMRNVLEQSGIVEDQVKSYIRSSTKAELDGYELVDTWEDDDYYWAYYRLSRLVFAEKRAQKLAVASGLSSELCTSAERYIALNDEVNGLRFYLQALLPLEKHFGEPVTADIHGKQVFLLNHIRTSIQHLLSSLEFNPAEVSLSTKVGQRLSQKESSRLVLHRDTVSHTISRMPLQAAFVKGHGEVTGRLETDKGGQVSLSNVVAKSSQHSQALIIRPDLVALLGEDSVSVILQSILGAFSLPRFQVIMDVLEARVLVEARELNFGSQVPTQYAESKIKKALSGAHCSFVDRSGDADFIIRVEAQTRKGTEIMGQYTAFADLTLSLVEVRSGKELYKNSIERTSGVHLDSYKAGLRALENAAGRLVAEILPEVTSKITQ